MDEIQPAQVDTATDISNHCNIVEKVVIAAKRNQNLSDIDGYSPWVLEPEEILDRDLHLNLLHVAAWTGHVPTIEYLRIENASVHITTAGGFTPLHLAASRGHTEVLDSLLRWGIVDVCAVSTEGFTALHLAAFGGHYECAKALLQVCPTNNKDAHINAKDEVLGRTALHWAVCHPSSRKLFDLLLENHEYEIDICATDRSGFTPLHFAVMRVTERVLTSEQKQTLLSKIEDPNLLQDDSTEEWIVDFFEDEGRRKLLSDHRSLKFSDGSLEQAILSERVLEDLPRRLVNELLKRNRDQVKTKVGNVRWFLSRHEVIDFPLQPWRKLSGIGTIHPRPGKMTGGMDITTAPTIHESMSGYSVLHFAACQDNAELVSYLLNIPGVNVNEMDMIYGMTPLHCSMWAGSVRAFLRLIAFEEVDVNAGLVRRGKGPRELVLSGEYSQGEGDDGSDDEDLLAPASRCSLWPRSMKRHYSRLITRNGGEYNARGEEVLVQVEDHTEMISQTSSDRKYLHPCLREFQSLETPLHLGIRFCPPESLWQMMITFCKHPKLDPAICNSAGLQPLQLAWARSVFTLSNRDSFPEKFVIPKELKKLKSSISKLHGIERNANLAPHEKVFIELQRPITLLEGHPGNKLLMTNMKDEERRFQNMTNVVLVAATVVAGFTFQGILQPPVSTPLNSKVTRFDNLAQAAFWLSNSFAFFVATTLILVCLESFAAQPALNYHRLYFDSHMYFAYQQRTTTVLLGWSIMSGLGTYYSASILDFRSKSSFSGVTKRRLYYNEFLCVWVTSDQG
ncbi:hypothetical protein R1sor_002599 [Riccia sorocarpa]|uniref:PGG domain-containing protein n=1 Tax=Riccia sorocarpa TaxID=122646 RepID=A0ABD3H2C8_9MARC